MILPTKRITPDRALLGIGANVLALLEEPKTVSRLWSDFKTHTQSKTPAGIVTYDWFVLSLDLLYMMGTIRVQEGLIQRCES
jgi:ABC-3C biological conflict system middle component